jgi:hypothetical protein
LKCPPLPGAEATILGYPTAHENDAERAVLAGFAILKAAATLKLTGDLAVQTRVVRARASFGRAIDQNLSRKYEDDRFSNS